MFKKKTTKISSDTIAINKHAIYDYSIIEEFQAGLILHGWEVKSLRNGNVDINNSYIILKNGDAFLFGANFMPLVVTSTHCVCNPTRTRKLLLNQKELNSIYGRVNIGGYTLISLSLFWKKNWCKIRIGVAKGKKEHDKRSSLKEREWKIDKERILKIKNINDLSK